MNPKTKCVSGKATSCQVHVAYCSVLYSEANIICGPGPDAAL